MWGEWRRCGGRGDVEGRCGGREDVEGGVGGGEEMWRGDVEGGKMWREGEEGWGGGMQCVGVQNRQLHETHFQLLHSLLLNWTP